METTYRNDMYSMSEWGCDHVYWNMIRSVQLILQRRQNILNGRTLHCKANMTEYGDCEANNFQNQPWNLHMAFPEVLVLTA
jgi:hypothetical protein